MKPSTITITFSAGFIFLLPTIVFCIFAFSRGCGLYLRAPGFDKTIYLRVFIRRQYSAVVFMS